MKNNSVKVNGALGVVFVEPVEAINRFGVVEAVDPVDNVDKLKAVDVEEAVMTDTVERVVLPPRIVQFKRHVETELPVL